MGRSVRMLVIGLRFRGWRNFVRLSTRRRAIKSRNRNRSKNQSRNRNRNRSKNRRWIGN